MIIIIIIMPKMHVFTYYHVLLLFTFSRVAENIDLRFIYILLILLLPHLLYLMEDMLRLSFSFINVHAAKNKNQNKTKQRNKQSKPTNEMK